MDKQMIEEMAKDIDDSMEFDDVYGEYILDFEHIAMQLSKLGYRKIPEGAVVLMGMETEQRFEDLMVAFDEMGFMPNTTHPFPEEYVETWKQRLIFVFGQLRKETAEKFAYMAKELLDKQEKGWAANMIWIITAKNCIDEVCKEITEGK